MGAAAEGPAARDALTETQRAASPTPSMCTPRVADAVVLHTLRWRPVLTLSRAPGPPRRRVRRLPGRPMMLTLTSRARGRRSSEFGRVQAVVWIAASDAVVRAKARDTRPRPRPLGSRFTPGRVLFNLEGSRHRERRYAQNRPLVPRPRADSPLLTFCALSCILSAGTARCGSAFGVELLGDGPRARSTFP